MGSGPHSTLTYIVDGSDRIVDIGGPWDEFAMANGAPALTCESVLGMPMRTFVSGSEMQELTKMLIARVRRGPVIPLEFRCDSPTERRYLQMSLSTLPGNLVRCATSLLRAEPRPSQPLLAIGTARSQHLLVVCSWCRRVLLPGGRWAEIDEAVETLALFLETELPQISHGICDACRDRMRGAHPRAGA
jgi:hypothetical protein